MTPIKYVTPRLEHQGLDSDTGQGLARTNACLLCAKWEGDRKMSPKLITDHRGFDICLCCHRSYGDQS